LLIIANFAFSYPLVLSDGIQHTHMRFCRCAPGARFNVFALS